MTTVAHKIISTSRLKFLLLPLLIALLFLASCDKKVVKDTATSRTKSYSKGPFKVDLAIDNTDIDLSQTVSLEIKIIHPQDYRVQVSSLQDCLQSFDIIDTDYQSDVIIDSNVTSSTTYRLEPADITHATTIVIDPNDPAILPLAFKFTNSYDETVLPTTVATDRIAIMVTQTEIDPNMLAAIQDIASPPSSGLWLLAPIAIVIILVILFVIFHNKKCKAVKTQNIIKKSADEIAMAQIESLLSKKLIEQQKLKEFYEKLCDILRHYIENRFIIAAAHQTTEEFLEEIFITEILSQDDKASLRKFLTHCDLVKFAKHIPGLEDINASTEMAKDFVIRTKQQEARQC